MILNILTQYGLVCLSNSQVFSKCRNYLQCMT